MRYAVRWLPTAQTQVLALVLRSADKDAILRAIEHVDEVLSRKPRSMGESRGRAKRLWFYRPLSFKYRIDRASRTVFIGQVRWVGR